MSESIHEKYDANSAIKELESLLNDFIQSDAGRQREAQAGDVRQYFLWLHANIDRNLLERALVEMNDWYKHHALKDILESTLKG